MSSDELRIQVGMEVFVLGYPFGISINGLPIWKRGSIASEPEILDSKHPYILIDTASRPGMSGSPIIRRSWGTHLLQTGNVATSNGFATTFFGIYSGRLATHVPSMLNLVAQCWPDLSRRSHLHSRGISSHQKSKDFHAAASAHRFVRSKIKFGNPAQF